MTTKMEKVAQDVVLAAARMAGTEPHRVLDQQAFKSAFPRSLANPRQLPSHERRHQHCRPGGQQLYWARHG